MSTSLMPQFWYVIAESHEVTGDTVLSRQILDEQLACYRDSYGTVVVAQDRCVHRCARLSSGTVADGQLHCRYHGWVYGQNGKVITIPVEGACQTTLPQRSLKAKTYKCIEQEGYVYVCLHQGEHTPDRPLTIVSLVGEKLKGSVRLQNRFNNSLANCIENYIDVPHTAYVHRGIFREPKGESIATTVSRESGSIHVQYHGEKMNLGTFSFFLNPDGKEIVHTDHFYAPNITSVHYRLPNGYRYSITSQSIPVSSMETLVYTDISYDFGIFTTLARPLVRRQAQTVILQDIDILDEQGSNIGRYGEKFYPTSADVIHTLTSEIIDALKAGIAVSEIPATTREVTFHV